jgi:hypothetical protein
MAGGMLKENELLTDHKRDGSQSTSYFLSQGSFRASVGFVVFHRGARQLKSDHNIDTR